MKLSFYQLNAHEIYFPFMFLDYYSNVVILKSSALFSVTYFGTALTTNTVRKAWSFGQNLPLPFCAPLWESLMIFLFGHYKYTKLHCV